MCLDLLADGLCNDSLGRAVGDVFVDDVAFFQYQAGTRVCIFQRVISS